LTDFADADRAENLRALEHTQEVAEDVCQALKQQYRCIVPQMQKF